jgi:hypothetical protein
MRTQRMPGATSKAWPNSGKVVPNGKLKAFSPVRVAAGAAGVLGGAVCVMANLGWGKIPQAIDVYVNVNYS